jgi:hypothetical protein
LTHLLEKPATLLFGPSIDSAPVACIIIVSACGICANGADVWLPGHIMPAEDRLAELPRANLRALANLISTKVGPLFLFFSYVIVDLILVVLLLV